MTPRTLAAASISAGICITIAVAWSASVAGPPDVTRALPRPAAWQIPVPPDWPPPDKATRRQSPLIRTDRLISKLSIQDQAFWYPVATFDTRAGWPWGALRYQELVNLRPAAKPRGTLPIGPWRSGIRIPDKNTDRRLPLLPLFPGFAADSALYAAASALLLTTARLFNSRRITRQNLCPHCRYPRVGLSPAAPCPECGRLPAGTHA